MRLGTRQRTLLRCLYGMGERADHEQLSWRVDGAASVMRSLEAKRLVMRDTPDVNPYTVWTLTDIGCDVALDLYGRGLA